jgi:hypothetical protein
MFGGLRGFEGDDYGVEIAEHGAVHLGQASVAAGFGSGDQLDSLLPLRVVLGQEFGGGDEQRTSQAGFSALTKSSL